MPPKRVNVVWFKCTDLRTHDHAALKAAHAEGLPVIHLYVFDPFWHANTTRICGFPKTGAIRTRFQLEALADLGERLEAKGHSLSTRFGVSTAACFEELCAEYVVSGVFAFGEICSEELRIERQVREVLRRRGQGQLRLLWGFELYHRDDLNFDPARARGQFNSYTAFRKRVEENSWVRPSSQEEPRFLSSESAVHWRKSTLPTVEELMGSTYDAALDPGNVQDPRAELKWRGGESAALDRVRKYLWEDDSLGLDYVGATMTTDVAKSCMRDKAMSKLSPWLAHGCISPRLLYEEVKRYERERRKTKSTYWITHELLWRDFVRFGSIHAGTSIFKIGGLTNMHPTWKWSTDVDMLKRWHEGRTGFPFIDCFMRELGVTGYCNHMGRECAGWFLIGDLGLDWRMGAEWFESVLIDYEPTANWYNWAYRCLPAASRGGAHGYLTEAPGHRLQGLEILRWGTQHDPDATYIKRWIPELASLPATIAREPWRVMRISHDERYAEGEHPQSDLRPVPAGDFEVPPQALEALLALGFDRRAAAVALHRCWDDPDAAAALLFSDPQGGDEGGEEDELARAIQLSLGEDAKPEMAGGQTRQDAVHRFRYGVDYPKAMIVPVSLRSSEGEEEKARVAQAALDRQRERDRAAASKGRFSKQAWEQTRGQHPAETPTAARKGNPGKAGGKAGGRAGGKASRPSGGEGNASADADSGGGKGRWQASSPPAGGAAPESKRRWGAKREPRNLDDPLLGA